MATGGSGDVLTGMLTGLMAQNYDPADAALLGTYLHGLAGDEAASKNGMESVIASDIIDNIPQAYKLLKN
jgi:NAD(P)H-hydrate epimerase